MLSPSKVFCYTVLYSFPPIILPRNIVIIIIETPSIAPTRVSTAAYLHPIITPTTPTSDSIDGYIQASSSVALVSLNEDLAPSPLPTNEPLPVTVQPLSTEPQTFTDEPGMYVLHAIIILTNFKDANNILILLYSFSPLILSHIII